MARFRLAGPAQIDLANTLATSAERWGADGRRRYAALLISAMRQVAADPEGPHTHRRADLRSGLRSFHIRPTRQLPTVVRKPVHVLYYRRVEPSAIEIVRVLHERMDPSRHLSDMRSGL